MAYRRSISIRATLLARRLNPSFAYISHDNNEHTKHHHQDLHSSGSSTKIETYFTHLRPFGSYVNNASMQFIRTLYSSRNGSKLVGNGPALSRFMSTSITDAPMNSVMNEVAIAAPDMANPSLFHFIDGVGSFTGLNWWASIALATFLIHGATIPLLIMRADYDSKYELMRERLEEIDKQMEEKEGMEHLVEVLVEKYKKMKVYKEYNVNPFASSMELFLQGTMYISFMFTILEMSQKIPSLKIGGALWFTDLTTRDATHILPVLTTLTYLAVLDILHMKWGPQYRPKKEHKWVALAVLGVQWAMYPKVVYFYLIPSGVFKLCFELVIKDPVGRKMLGLSEIPAEAPSSISANNSKNSNGDK